MRLVHPEAGRIQQGAIFNCVNVPGYEGWPCSGIVMTARCDLEHGKQSVVNYLPIVPFKAWTKRELCYLVAKQLRNDLISKIRNYLMNNGATSQILETFPLSEIIRIHTKKKDLARVQKWLDDYDLAERVSWDSHRICEENGSILGIGSAVCDRIVADLIHQKISEYYFLECTDVDERNEAAGSVVLLRRMQTMESRSMATIMKGISEEDAPGLGFQIAELTFAFDPICMITGVLRSPDMEHLAQTFGSLFLRIGLVDQKETTIESHKRIAKEE